ncbi:MAG TPA: hypothetical protein VNK94_11700, partial [Gaiellaceae bacterium]|nr:hypothetical protein [Gaiellaceae bacterium]
SFELLRDLRGVVGQFGSNLAPSGRIETLLWEQNQLVRSVERGVLLLSRSGWHPGARYAAAELGAAGWGVGF